MGMDSPLFLVKVECPVCGTVNEIETIRVGAYTEGERQTDFCATVIKWRNPRYQKYHPLLFFTATCAKCFYTREYNNSFKEWGKDNNFRTYRLKVIKERHLDELASDDSFIRLVGNAIDHEKYPYESAVLKLAMAAYDELLYDHPAHLDLGRFYLRIAWLYRFMNTDSKEKQIETVPNHIDDIERGLGELNNWFAGLTRNIKYLNDAIIAHCDQRSSSGPDIETEKDQYMDSIIKLTNLETTGLDIMKGLESQVKSSKAGFGVDSDSGSGLPFHDNDSFTGFLSGLKRYWDGLPCTEIEAMRFAAKHYIAAYESGKQIAQGNQSIQAAYLIAELSRQVGDHDTARQYFNTTIKTGQEFINEIRGDRTRTALARKILELAMKQGKKNLAEAK